MSENEKKEKTTETTSTSGSSSSGSGSHHHHHHHRHKLSSKKKLLYKRLIIIGIFVLVSIIIIAVAAIIRNVKKPVYNGDEKSDTESAVVTKSEPDGSDPDDTADENAVVLPESKVVDLIVFAGQSNMAGRGNGSLAPECPEYCGVEFRAVSDPTKLYAIDESERPFGLEENHAYGLNGDLDGIDDTGSTGNPLKSGSLVPAFINAYYENTGRRVVAVSASKGSTTSVGWTKAARGLYTGLIQRYKAAKDWLNGNGYTIGHKYIVWLQGESDLTVASPNEYVENINSLFNEIISPETDIEKMLVIRIGYKLGQAETETIVAATDRLCAEKENIIMISTRLTDLYTIEYYNNDLLHFNQSGLNIVGEDAGKNAAAYVMTGATLVPGDN